MHHRLSSRRAHVLAGIVAAAIQIAPAAAQTSMNFTDAAATAGVRVLHSPPLSSSFMYGGGAAGDFNNDGWPDLYVVGGGGPLGPDRLFLNNGDGTFTDHAAAWGVADLHVGFGIALGDYNRDGWLDAANLAQSGPYAAENPFRFSTKWFDDETTLGYWGYRYYLPSLGRWINRDPYYERGGINLQACVRNRPTNAIDPLGLDVYQAPKPEFIKKACGTCGADITDWFRDEFAAQRAGWDAYKADYQERTGLGIGWYQYVWWAYHNQYYKPWAPNMWAPHPSGGHHYAFNKGTSCGKKGQCDLGCGSTVTLCGKCVPASVLGNLMFGLMARHAQLSLDDVRKYAQDIIGDYGSPDPYDPPVYGVGYDTYGEYDSFGTGSAFCQTLLRASADHGVRLEWTGDRGAQLYTEAGGQVAPHGTPSIGVGDRSSCEPCAEGTKETRHSGTDPVLPWGKPGRGS